MKKMAARTALGALTLGLLALGNGIAEALVRLPKW